MNSEEESPQTPSEIAEAAKNFPVVLLPDESVNIYEAV